MSKEVLGLDYLKLVDLPDPEPGHQLIRIRMTAASLNYRDLPANYPRGRLPPAAGPAFGRLRVVEAVGPGVTAREERRPHHAVFPGLAVQRAHRAGLATALGGSLDGRLTEKMVLSEEGAIRVPEAASAIWKPPTSMRYHRLACPGWRRSSPARVVQGTGGFHLRASVAKASRPLVIATSSSDSARTRQGAGGRPSRQPQDDARMGQGGDGASPAGAPTAWSKLKRRGTLLQSLHAIRIGGGAMFAVIGHRAESEIPSIPSSARMRASAASPSAAAR